MANEAVPIIAPTKFSQVTVADGTAITKYTLLKLATDPNTAIASSGTGDVFAGILMHDKTISDGSTTATAALDGEWDLTFNAGAGGTLGAMLVLSGANLVRAAVAGELLTGAIVGKLLETASASEVVRVRLGAI